MPLIDDRKPPARILRQALMGVGLCVALAVVIAGVLWVPITFLRAFEVIVAVGWCMALSALVIGLLSLAHIRPLIARVVDRYLPHGRSDTRTVLNRLSEEALALADVRQVAELTVTTLASIMRVAHCALWLREPDTGRYTLTAYRGVLPTLPSLSPDSPLVLHAQSCPCLLDVEQAAHTAQLPEPVLAQLQMWQARLVLPLQLHGELVGLITLGRTRSKRSVAVQDLAALQASAHTLTIGLTNARLFTELAHTRAAAVTDALTGLLVRRAFLEQGQRVLQQAQVTRTPAALLLLDLDHFKAVNDTYGSPVGDAVLQEVATRLSQLLRSGDLLGRFGGEELVLLLPSTDRGQALVIAERLRQIVAVSPVVTDAGRLSQTVSVGASVSPDDGTTLEALLATAGAALAAAKRTGRNRVSQAPHWDQPLPP